MRKPYHRTFRRIKEGANAGHSERMYIRDADYARSPQHYVRAYKLIQKDLQKLFEFIEPSDSALDVYSYRIHELLMRTCIEVEANFRAILDENDYTPNTDRFDNPIYNIRVYKKVEVSHRLSSYIVKLPTWNGPEKVWQPYRAWQNDGVLEWYRAYNESKHQRHENFSHANFGMLMSAICGLLVLLSAQFKQEDFSSGPDGIIVGGAEENNDMEHAIGGLFRIRFPDDWAEGDLYDFNWGDLVDEPEKFEKFDYNAVN